MAEVNSSLAPTPPVRPNVHSAQRFSLPLKAASNGTATVVDKSVSWKVKVKEEAALQAGELWQLCLV